MTIVLESLKELVDYELAVVLRYDGRDTLRVLRAMGPLAKARLEGYAISLTSRPDLADILSAGTPRLFDTDRGYVDTYVEVLDLPEGHSCLAAPLVVDGTAVGLLTLDHRSCGVFTPDILRFIAVISRLVSIALLQTDATAELRDNNARLLAERNTLLDVDADPFRDLVGRSPAWTAALDAVRLVAAAESPVLLLGETGTGKEEAARAIHRLSRCSPGPFIALNCSALPSALAESELFGHEKGAFTGAQSLRRGRFELADGGTLFLDEVADLPLEIQPKLLRALQEGRFERVGSEMAISVDVRIVAATHVDVTEAVHAGRFREDLYFRLAVFPIRMPPLRERGDDAILLAELFAAKIRAQPGWDGLCFDAEALASLRSRRWPGNVRELRNTVERAAILARGGLIRRADLHPWDPTGSPEATDASARAGRSDSTAVLTLDGFVRERIVETLTRTRGRIYGRGGAAELLGMKPSTLQSRMKKLGIERAGSASRPG